jgi:hypothetical protein
MITDINSSKYPSNYDDDNSLVYIKPGETEVSALHLNQLRSSIFAIERALGINPGAGMTVSQRLSALSKDLSELFNGTLRHSLVFAYDKNGYAARAIFGESCETWIIFDGNKKELANWPDTGREFDAFVCEGTPNQVVPLSIVGNESGAYRGRRIRMYDSVEITKSLRLEKIPDPNDSQHTIFAGVLEAPWGMMTRGAFDRREPFDFTAGLSGCGAIVEPCVVDETSDWPLDCWVDYEIVQVGDPRWVNVTGDCMVGDLRMAFGSDTDGYGDVYGGTNGYPAAILFGFCEPGDTYAYMMIDPYDVRLNASDNSFEYFVHESVAAPIKPLVIGGSNALEGDVISSKRRLKLINDVDIAGSARVNTYMYVGTNEQVNTKPNFTRDIADPNYPQVYNGFIVNPNSSVFSTPYYTNGYVGAGVTYGHRPGHTHSMADILDLDVSVAGPEIVRIYDTYDTDPQVDAPHNKSDHVKGRVVVNESGFADGMKVEVRRVHFDVAAGIYPLLVFKNRAGAQTYTYSTRNGYWTADIAVLEFDLDHNNMPIGEYDAWIEDTNGLRGYSYYVRSGGLDVVDPLLADINHPGPTGSGSLQTSTVYTFSANVTGGKQPYVEYDWDFGDGTGSTGSNPTPQHTYTQAGVMNVSLTVYDVNNFYYTTTRQFAVLQCATNVTLTFEIV